MTSTTDVGLSSPPAVPPHVQVVQMAGGHFVAKALYAIAELGVADHLQKGPQTAEQLAVVTHTSGPALHRLLRTMAGFGFFTEDELGRFALTPLSDALRSDAPGCLRSTVRMMAGPGMWSAAGELMHSVRTSETAFDKATGQPVFAYLADRPTEAHYFNEAMIGFHGAEPPAVAAAYDFSPIGTLIDVGGGTGNLLTTILQSHQNLQGVLFDQAHVAAEARRMIAAMGLEDRCEVKEGNFFDSIPTGGDAYLMSHIIHDWEESKCLTILENCRTALQGRGRLLLVEMVIPEGNDFHPGKFLDLIMLTVTGGRERTTAEYRELLAKAGFELTAVVPTASPVSVVEARPR